MKSLFVLVAALVIPSGVLDKLAESGKPIQCSMNEVQLAGETNCTDMTCRSGHRFWRSKDAICDDHGSDEVIQEDEIIPESTDDDAAIGGTKEFQTAYRKTFL